jgi:hypothetical protein
MRKATENLVGRDASGMTLIDQLVVMAGVVPAILIAGVGPEPWRFFNVCVLMSVFGITFWCVFFLWLVPLMGRHGPVEKKDAER